jgi:DnaJ-class molecular chaperone
VASENTDSEDQAEESHGPRECMPCSGSGQLISNLGGTPSKVQCPWCGGGGVRVAGTDAQAAWPANELEPPAPDPSTEPAPEQAA